MAGSSHAWTITTDPQHWRDLVHALVIFPIRLFSFVLSVVFPVVGLGGTVYVLWEWALPRDTSGNYPLAELIGLGSTRVADIAVNTIVGVIFLAASPLEIRGLATMDAGLARALLGDEHAGLRARVDRLAATRAAAVDAEARTLRKVERDIHDGPQQRLVRLTMDLQSAQRRLADDPAAAENLVSGALLHAQDALAELRAVSRGIAPPVLADRGLGAALAAAAARSPVPMTLDVRLEPGERLAPAVENALYYIVVESLTNVAKHAEASMCTVTVERHRLGPDRLGLDRPGGDVVRAWVLDNGRGGAHVGRRHQRQAATTRRLRVVLADDSVLLREGLIRLVEEVGCTVVAAVGDGDALVAASLSIGPMSRSLKSGCRPPTPTRVFGPRSRHAARCRAQRSSCCRSMSRSPTPATCSPTVPAGLATCSKTG